MEKRISYSQFQSVRSVAKACDPLITKRNKVSEKISKLIKEYNDYNTQIESLETGIKSIIGFSVEQLVKKVIEPGVDANGNPKKTTKYLPTSIVSYDEEKKQYVITVEDNKEDNKEDFKGTAPEGMIVENDDKGADNGEEADDTNTEDSKEDSFSTNTSIFE